MCQTKHNRISGRFEQLVVPDDYNSPVMFYDSSLVDIGANLNKYKVKQFAYETFFRFV